MVQRVLAKEKAFMTRYCVALERHELIATWGTGEGELAAGVAALPAGLEAGKLLALARALTQLSSAAWRTYTHPSAAGSMERNSEGWRREEERKHFSEVLAAISDPHLPSGGTLLVSYSPLLETAHRAGRALREFGDAQLTKSVIAEAAAELAAVDSAELGDLGGRAQQAVLLSREDASPVQVAAADRLLEQDPFGCDELFISIDPTAAAVAAAHWLAAAAEVAAAASGDDPTEVVCEADNIEALPHRTPTAVLELLSEGVSPREAVTGLVRHAMHLTDGLLFDPDALREQLDDLDETLAQYAESAGQEPPDPTGIALRLTTLDPQRPARDLLEDLLAGIRGCWLLHSECADPDDDQEQQDAQGLEEPDEEVNEERSGTRSRRCAGRPAAGSASPSSYGRPPPTTGTVSSDRPRTPGRMSCWLCRQTCAPPAPTHVRPATRVAMLASGPGLSPAATTPVTFRPSAVRGCGRTATTSSLLIPARSRLTAWLRRRWSSLGDDQPDRSCRPP